MRICRLIEIFLTSLWFKNFFIISIPSSWGTWGYNPTTSNDTSNAFSGRCLIISVIRVRMPRVSSRICNTFVTTGFTWKSREVEMFSLAVLLLEITDLPGTLVVLLWIFEINKIYLIVVVWSKASSEVFLSFFLMKLSNTLRILLFVLVTGSPPFVS